MVEIVNEQWKSEVSNLLQQETDRLKALARAEVDDFWVTHYKVRENEPFKDWGLLGVRIRDFKYGFGIEWYINSFHGQRGKRVVSLAPLVGASDLGVVLAQHQPVGSECWSEVARTTTPF